MSADDPDSAPLLAAWARFTDSSPRPMTIPGHKRRAGRVSPLLERVLATDVPMYGGLAPVKEAVATVEAAEALTARRWGADWCRYGTGGTTQANQIAALSVGRPGDTVLVARNAHRSTLSGLVLAGLDPVWLGVGVDAENGLPLGVAPDDLAAAFAEHPRAVGVFLAEPSYVGTLSDRRRLVRIAHDHGAAVVVDQAWGAHFGFHPGYPQHAIALGADVVTFSAHKTLPAYSQASVALARSGRVDLDRLQRGYELLSTTSPAGSILASTDAACALLAGPEGRQLLVDTAERVRRARTALREGVPGLVAPELDDPAKLVLLLSGAGVDGLALEDGLVERGMPVEQADRHSLVAVVTMLDDDATLGAFVDAVVELASRCARASAPRRPGWHLPMPQVAVGPREAFLADHEVVPAAQARGRISAEVIAPYPPGIPVLAPGEVVSDEVIGALTDARARGVRIAYAADPTLATFRVVRRAPVS